MIYGYMRVSTVGQVKGNSLEEQEKILRDNGAMILYQDTFTGTKTSRPNFNKLMEVLQEGDTLIITKLDRFARNTVEGINVVQTLLDRGVRVSILNMGTVDNTPTGKLILTVMLGFAEFERDMIIQRTAAGKSIAKEKEGYQEGRPRKYSPEDLERAVRLLEIYSYREVASMTKISKSTLVRAVREMREKREKKGDCAPRSSVV